MDSNNNDKIRLDIYLTKEFGVQSRAKAKQMIEAGYININGSVITKSAFIVSPGDKITIENTLKYVSRGGLKLEKALNVFSINPEGKIALDIGASTGGFTDCLLQNHASKVFAVDVGHSQLAETLCNNERVINIEKTHIKYLIYEHMGLGSKFDIITIDVSFISLKIVLSNIIKFLDSNTDIICLLKPQFEAGKTKKGIIKNVKEHKNIIYNVLQNAKEQGFCIYGFDFSPIQGGDGNIEYLVYLKYLNEEINIDYSYINSIIDKSHIAFKR